MRYLTVIPAYGRDYTSAKSVKADWEANKDFLIQDISSPHDSESGKLTVHIRYKKLANIAVVKV